MSTITAVATETTLPQIRVKSFEPAKFTHLAEDALPGLLGSVLHITQNNWCGKLGVHFDNIFGNISVPQLLLMMEPKYYSDLLRILEAEVKSHVFCFLDDTESAIITSEEFEKLFPAGDRTNLRCTLEIADSTAVAK